MSKRKLTFEEAIANILRFVEADDDNNYFESDCEDELGLAGDDLDEIYDDDDRNAADEDSGDDDDDEDEVEDKSSSDDDQPQPQPRREERCELWKSDRFAAARKLAVMFNEQMKNVLVPSEYL